MRRCHLIHPAHLGCIDARGLLHQRVEPRLHGLYSHGRVIVVGSGYDDGITVPRMDELRSRTIGVEPLTVVLPGHGQPLVIYIRHRGQVHGRCLAVPYSAPVLAPDVSVTDDTQSHLLHCLSLRDPVILSGSAQPRSLALFSHSFKNLSAAMASFAISSVLPSILIRPS